VTLTFTLTLTLTLPHLKSVANAPNQHLGHLTCTGVHVSAARRGAMPRAPQPIISSDRPSSRADSRLTCALKRLM
jgi:hypothetical protein